MRKVSRLKVTPLWPDDYSTWENCSKMTKKTHFNLHNWTEIQNLSYRFSFLSHSFPSSLIALSLSSSTQSDLVFSSFHLMHTFTLKSLLFFHVRNYPRKLCWAEYEGQDRTAHLKGGDNRWVSPGSLNGVSTPAGSSTGLTSLPCKLLCWCHNRVGYTLTPAHGIKCGTG